MIFESLQQHNYEQIMFCQDRDSGLKVIIAIHDTTLGPALGGTRMWPYASERDAIDDALRLSRGMTYKSAAAGLPLGGGKAVIIGDPKRDKSEALFRAYGKFIQSLNGKYITAEDVGTNVTDMDIIRSETHFVTGVSPAFGSSGNPSPVTAYGVYKGMKAAALEAFGSARLDGKVVAVQGVGSVAYALCRYLHEEGARLIVTDLDETRVLEAEKEFGARRVGLNEIYEANCDIFAPCAMGAVLNDVTIPKLKAKVVAGAANNQLKENKHGDLLMNKGIVYAPDYLINAGGIINVADELQGYNRERAMRSVEKIFDNLIQVFDIARHENIPTYLAADRLAERRIEAVKQAGAAASRESL